MIALFFLGFAGGILFVNLWGSVYLETDRILDQDMLALVGQTQVDARSLFFFVLVARGKWFLLFWLLGYTLAGMPVTLLFLGWLGFTLGVFAGAFVMQQHMLGILLFLTALLPQAFFYVPCAWTMARAVYDRGIRRFRRKERTDDAQEDGTYLHAVAVALALLLAGAALESTANPWLLKQAAEYFF